jgi:hypothetical protein
MIESMVEVPRRVFQYTLNCKDSTKGFTCLSYATDKGAAGLTMQFSIATLPNNVAFLAAPQIRHMVVWDSGGGRWPW